ncbi:MAG TPA: hypothetical protein VGD81_03085 [Opitutaceae bacterium]
MKSKFPALFAAALVSTLTTIACTKTDPVASAEASARGGAAATEAPAKHPAAKSDSAPAGKAKRPLHERAGVWLT